jgi:hypothetical protein
MTTVAPAVWPTLPIATRRDRTSAPGFHRLGTARQSPPGTARRPLLLRRAGIGVAAPSPGAATPTNSHLADLLSGAACGAVWLGSDDGCLGGHHTSHAEASARRSTDRHAQRSSGVRPGARPSSQGGPHLPEVPPREQVPTKARQRAYASTVTAADRTELTAAHVARQSSRANKRSHGTAFEAGNLWYVDHISEDRDPDSNRAPDSAAATTRLTERASASSVAACDRATPAFRARRPPPPPSPPRATSTGATPGSAGQRCWRWASSGSASPRRWARGASRWSTHTGRARTSPAPSSPALALRSVVRPNRGRQAAPPRPLDAEPGWLDLRANDRGSARPSSIRRGSCGRETPRGAVTTGSS